MTDYDQASREIVNRFSIQRAEKELRLSQAIADALRAEANRAAWEVWGLRKHWPIENVEAELTAKYGPRPDAKEETP